MVPFMFNQLLIILNRLLGLIFKSDKLSEAKTITMKMKVEWLKNKDNYLEDSLVDVGAATNDDLKKVKVVAEKKKNFRKQCKLLMLNILLKLQERLPSRCAIVQNAASLCPVNMVSTSEKQSKRFKILAGMIYSERK